MLLEHTCEGSRQSSGHDETRGYGILCQAMRLPELVNLINAAIDHFRDNRTACANNLYQAKERQHGGCLASKIRRDTRTQVDDIPLQFHLSRVQVAKYTMPMG